MVYSACAPTRAHVHTYTQSSDITSRNLRVTCALFNFTVYNSAVRLPALCAQPCLALGENSIGRVKRTRARRSFLGLRTRRERKILSKILGGRGRGREPKPSDERASIGLRTARTGRFRCGKLGKLLPRSRVTSHRSSFN